jgi:predicted transposase YdaD
VVMAHLKTQETKGNASSRKAWKLTLLKRLYGMGYSRSDILNLYTFIDWAMILPEGLKRAFWEELKTYEEERQMAYVTTGEQIGMEKGIEQTTKAIALNLLQESIPLETIARTTGLSLTQLKKLQAENQ